jgi:hypothetical protein
MRNPPNPQEVVEVATSSPSTSTTPLTTSQPDPKNSQTTSQSTSATIETSKEAKLPQQTTAASNKTSVSVFFCIFKVFLS